MLSCRLQPERWTDVWPITDETKTSGFLLQSTFWCITVKYDHWTVNCNKEYQYIDGYSSKKSRNKNLCWRTSSGDKIRRCFILSHLDVVANTLEEKLSFLLTFINCTFIDRCTTMIVRYSGWISDPKWNCVWQRKPLSTSHDCKSWIAKYFSDT